MDIIKPDGSKAEVKPEDGKEKAPEPEKGYVLKADFNTPGWMKLEINIDALSYDKKGSWMLRGFLEEQKEKALDIIDNILQQRANVTAALQKTQAKNGFRGFLDKLRK